MRREEVVKAMAVIQEWCLSRDARRDGTRNGRLREYGKMSIILFAVAFCIGFVFACLTVCYAVFVGRISIVIDGKKFEEKKNEQNH